MSEAILVGGSRDGFVTEAVTGMASVNNVSLNEELDGPEYVDLYIPTQLSDKEGRAIFVHVGRYDAEESKSYWESLDEEERTSLIESTKEIREEAARLAEEEAAAKAEEEAKANAEKEEAGAETEGSEEKPEEGSETVTEVTPEDNEEKPEEKTE